ncbi:AraC family transcriptional regulator [Roseivirga sp. E12]|uniref:helix-turn-helix domain-containing protein n=1 Tax=Roseivirga sp. E12 TaxID=2819237 RepID=UPI001ABD2D85|nr:helix-turn-helix domain-containing protein [Roseivirga sp. E12]MBO3698174.1 helix-turn-helix transcriptional regulator [Roseivirga sp. E12]
MKKGNEGNTSALYVWNGISMFWGASFHTDPHTHNTLQLVFDMDKSFLLKDADSEWTAYNAALIGANHLHQLDSNDSIQLFIYLDAESEYAKSLDKKYLVEKKMCPLPGKLLRNLSNDFFKRLLLNSDCESLLKACHTILDQLIVSKSTKPLDSRVAKALEFISRNANRSFKVGEVASDVCLSESRLRHLFKKEVGQPIQHFIQWMRVVDSLNMVLNGKQVSQSAIDAGFWDGAHMTKSYKDVLGIAPSKVETFGKEFKIVACTEGNVHTLRTEIRDDWQGNTVKKVIEI